MYLTNNLHWPCVNVKQLYTCEQCKSKKFGRISVNHLHLHEIYMPFIWLLTLNTTLVRTYKAIYRLDKHLQHKREILQGISFFRMPHAIFFLFPVMLDKSFFF